MIAATLGAAPASALGATLLLDPAGDSGAAPDIRRIDSALGENANGGTTLLEVVTFLDRSDLVPSEHAEWLVDSDQDPATGEHNFGLDVFIRLDGRTGADRWSTWEWDGQGWAPLVIEGFVLETLDGGRIRWALDVCSDASFGAPAVPFRGGSFRDTAYGLSADLAPGAGEPSVLIPTSPASANGLPRNSPGCSGSSGGPLPGGSDGSSQPGVPTSPTPPPYNPGPSSTTPASGALTDAFTGLGCTTRIPPKGVTRALARLPAGIRDWRAQICQGRAGPFRVLGLVPTRQSSPVLLEKWAFQRMKGRASESRLGNRCGEAARTKVSLFRRKGAAAITFWFDNPRSAFVVTGKTVRSVKDAACRIHRTLREL